jgi:hypothetical protein
VLLIMLNRDHVRVRLSGNDSKIVAMAWRQPTSGGCAQRARSRRQYQTDFQGCFDREMGLLPLVVSAAGLLHRHRQ